MEALRDCAKAATEGFRPIAEAGDETTKAPETEPATAIGRHLRVNGRGVDGALMDVEYQHVDLIKFNLFDNQTYEDYVKGRDGFDGRVLKVWKEMRLPSDHPNF